MKSPKLPSRSTFKIPDFQKRIPQANPTKKIKRSSGPYSTAIKQNKKVETISHAFQL